MPSLLRSEAVERAAQIVVTQMFVSLDLTLDDPTVFDSTAVIDFIATPGAATFVDFKGRQLLSANLNGQAVDVTTWADGRLPLANLQQQNRLVVHGIMAYSSDGEGLHRHVDQADGRTYLYAMSFLDAAPRWFACFDQPDLKAPYRFDVTAPADWTVWGNGPSVEVDAPPATRRWTIDQPCPLATYFVTLAAGPWAVVQDHHDGIPLALLTRQSLADELAREAHNILDVTKASFDAYHAMFGIRYPYGDYTQVFVPDFNAGAMENPGCITLRDQYLLRGRPTRQERAQRAGTIAHEMAHQWFGDLVTMRWWDDLWLNESFAEYMGHRVVSEHTSYDLWTQFGIMRKDWGSVADQGPSTHPVAVNGANDAQGALADFDGISYAKGASLLRQMVAMMGDDVFLRGLNAYFTSHRFGNATFADLMDTWQAAGAHDMDLFAYDWLGKCGMDKISVSADGAVLQFDRGRQGPAAQEVGIAVQVAALAGDGTELDRQTVLDVAPGQFALTPPPAGTAVVVPDPADLCWARLRPSNWQLPPIARVWDGATRVVLHNSIRDAVRGGDLPVADALGLLIEGLPGESSDDIVASMLGFAVDLAGAWSPFAQRANRMADVTSLVNRMMDAAQPGSDRQMITARALARCTTNTDLLTAWLQPDADLGGLVPDPDLRWAAVTRLVALGGRQALIDEELTRDPLGADKAAGARAAAPTAAAKQDALDVLLRPSNRRAYELYAIAEHIWQVGQEQLCADFIGQWFDGIGATAGFRQGWALAKVARLSFPVAVATDQTLDVARATLAHVTDERLHRELADSVDLLGRVLKARSVLPLERNI